MRRRTACSRSFIRVSSRARAPGTYSLVAFDPDTGEHGAAVHSHWFSVGSLCIWARPGIGAVATQSVVEPAHGPHGLDRLAAGDAAADALAALLGPDELAAVRQVGIVDAAGRVAVHTGADCIPCAGDADRRARLRAGEHDGPRHRARRDGGGLRGGRGRPRRPAAGGARRRRGRGRRRPRPPVLGAASSCRREGEAWQARFELRVEDHADPVERAAAARAAGARLRARRARPTS